MSAALTKLDSLIDFVDSADDQKSNDRITLGYWKIHGLAATAKMLITDEVNPYCRLFLRFRILCHFLKLLFCHTFDE